MSVESPARLPTQPANFTRDEVRELLERQGDARVEPVDGPALSVVQDRVRLAARQRARIVEDVEAAFKHGNGRVEIRVAGEGGDEGGYLVAEGPPEAVAAVREGSHTARVLRPFLKARSSA